MKERAGLAHGAGDFEQGRGIGRVVGALVDRIGDDRGAIFPRQAAHPPQVGDVRLKCAEVGDHLEDRVTSGGNLKEGLDFRIVG